MESILIRKVLSKLPGGTGSLLALSDEGVFVVKRRDNPQGPNTLANELLGTELMRLVGLPVPEWRFARYEASIPLSLESQEQSWILPSTLCFASRFLGSTTNHQHPSIFPPQSLHRLANRNAYIGAFVFDVWTGSSDRRQAIFMEDTEAEAFHATFIDNGSLFGGPGWTFRNRPGSHLCLDRSIYPLRLPEMEVSHWIRTLCQTIPDHLTSRIEAIPEEWYTGDIKMLQDLLSYRLECLEYLVWEEVDELQESPAPCTR